MKGSSKCEYPGWFVEPTFDFTQDINGVRDGIGDIRKGVASMFLQQSGEGIHLIGDGIYYIQQSVSRIREKLHDEDIVSPEGHALLLSGIEAELEAVALLKEGLNSFGENHFAQGTQNIVQGLFLSEKGLNDITEGGKGVSLHDKRKVIRNLRRNVLNLQAAMKDIADGLDEIQSDSIEGGIKTIQAATGDISAALEMTEDCLQSLCDEEPEYLRLMIEGVQMVEEGQAHIRSGLSAFQSPGSKDGCPVCLCIEQIEKALLKLRDGIRDLKRGTQSV